MESGEQGHIEYKGLNVQREASKEISGLICRFIYYWWDDFYQCSQVTAAKFDEDLPGNEYQ